MAIFNSFLLGNVKKSVANLTMYGVKGVSIVRVKAVVNRNGTQIILYKTMDAAFQSDNPRIADPEYRAESLGKLYQQRHLGPLHPLFIRTRITHIQRLSPHYTNAFHSIHRQVCY